jgi:endonuclease-3
VSAIAEENHDPFRVLVATVISLRTKDDVTTAASERLVSRAPTPAALAQAQEREIAEAIYPAGFYRTKAARLKEIGRILSVQYGGTVPRSESELLELPGVGRKTANLVLSLGFGLPAICVDTHVHRISNRLGWVTSRSPEETERQLQAVLPKEYWREINGLLVAFGQQTCTPTSPRCSSCPLAQTCPMVGVTKSR